MDNKQRNNAILQMRKKYNPSQLVRIDCIIRKLALDHYMYGKHMSLCIGKARGIRNILEIFYHSTVTLEYVWVILEDFQNEPKS